MTLELLALVLLAGATYDLLKVLVFDGMDRAWTWWIMRRLTKQWRDRWK